MASAVSAIIAVARTLPGSSLTYLFQRRSSDRIEASRFHRQLRAERVDAYSAYATAVTEYARGQLDWYSRRAEDPESAATMAARVESYRPKGVTQIRLSRIRLLASDRALMAAAGEAFLMTRPSSAS
jgi:hypothetical protein